MTDLASQLYAELGIAVVVRSRTNLVDIAPAELKRRIIREDCAFNVPPTPQEKELYQFQRPNAIPKEIVVYFIESTTPSSFGCVFRHPGRPSILITQFAPSWTLSHEIAHIHGLTHVKDTDNLMNPNTRFRVRPSLTNAQKQKIRGSEFLFPLG
jgi:hypothetical protein